MSKISANKMRITIAAVAAPAISPIGGVLLLVGDTGTLPITHDD